MRVTPPVPITSIELVSSTAAEPSVPAAYAGGTTYGFGAIVSVAADYAIYESLKSGNVGHTPSTSPLWWRKTGPTETAYDPARTNYALGETCSANNRVYESLVLQSAANPLPVLPETETNFWIDVGPTNRHAMFDLDSNTQTVLASPLTAVFAPGQRINTLGLTGLSGATAAVVSATSVTGGGTVYGPRTIDLNTRVVLDAYDYAFEPFSTMAGFVLFDLPPYSDIVVTVTLTCATGNVKCGALVAGTYIYLGDTVRGARRNGKNFSTVDRDKYGKATLVRRRTLPVTTQTLRLPSYRVNKAEAAKVLLNATPALWTGLDDATNDYFDMLTILGIYTEFEIGAVLNTNAEISLSLEEI